MSYGGDPLRDFDRYDARQQRKLDRMPKCVCCGEPIQDEHCYEINNGLLCSACSNDGYIE